MLPRSCEKGHSVCPGGPLICLAISNVFSSYRAFPLTRCSHSLPLDALIPSHLPCPGGRLVVFVSLFLSSIRPSLVLNMGVRPVSIVGPAIVGEHLIGGGLYVGQTVSQTTRCDVSYEHDVVALRLAHRPRLEGLICRKYPPAEMGLSTDVRAWIPLIETEEDG